MTADSFMESLALGGLTGHDAFYNGLSQLRRAYNDKNINSVEAKKAREKLARHYGVSLGEAESTWKNLSKDGLAAPDDDTPKEGQLAYLSWVLGLEVEGFKVYKPGDSTENQYYMQVYINDQSREVALGSLDNIDRQSKFRVAVANQIGVWPARVDKNGWDIVLETIMRVLEQITMDEISEGSQLKVWVVRYLKENAANNGAEDFYQHVAIGDPVSVDFDIYINTVSFHRYLVTTFREKITLTSLGKLLNKYGFKTRRFRKGGLDMLYRLVPAEYTQEFTDAGILQPGPKNSQAELKALKDWDWQGQGDDES